MPNYARNRKHVFKLSKPTFLSGFGPKIHTFQGGRLTRKFIFPVSDADAGTLRTKTYRSSKHLVPLDDVGVYEGGDDGECDDLSPIIDNLGDLLVLDAHHVLTIHL